MKKIIEVTETEGLEKLLGEKVQLWCECYIYSGYLKGVNEHSVLLEEAYVVYETGPLTESGFKDAQPLGIDWYVAISKIESFGIVK